MKGLKASIKHFLDYIKKNGFLILFLILILVLLSYSYFKHGIVYSLINQDAESLINFVGSFGVFAIIAFIILVILEVVLAPIPSIVLYAVGGIVFGTFLGGTAALIGNIIGAVIAFKIAQKYGRKYAERKTNKKKLAVFDKYAKKYGKWAILLLRINPITSSDIFSYLAGLSKMPLRHLIFGTAFGLAPLAYIQAYFGEGFIKNYPPLYSLAIVISILYIAAFFYGIHRFRK